MSWAFLGVIATLTTGDTLNFMVLQFTILACERGGRGRGEGCCVLEAARCLTTAEGAGLEQIFVDTDKTNEVAAWCVCEILNVAPHCKADPLNAFHEEVGSGARYKIGSHDPHLAVLSDSGEDSTVGIVPSLVARHHLADVDHQGSVRVTNYLMSE